MPVRTRAIIGAGVLLVVCVLFYFAVAHGAAHAHDKEQALADGFAAMNAETAAENADLQAKNVDLAMQIIDYARQGNGDPSAQDLQQYIKELTWEKTQIAGQVGMESLQRDVDRDINWCQRRLAKIEHKR